MKKRFLAGLAGASALAIALAGCAGPTAPAEGEPVTITWLQWWANEKGMETLNQIKDAFEASHPDIILEIQDVPNAEAHDKITTLSLGGQAPDLFAMQAAWQTEFALSGIIEPLDSYIESEDASFLDELEGPMLAPYNDAIWGIPLNFSPTAMYYNQDILDAAGVEVPTTWDEFTEASETIAGSGKFAVTANLAVEPPTPISYEIFPFILSAGGEILDDNNEAAFASPEGVEALEYVKSLWDTPGVATPGAAGTTEAQKRENFIAGNTAFMFDGPAGISIAATGNPDMKVGVAPMPAGAVNASYVGGSLLGMNAASEKKEAAWEFMSWLGSEEGSALWAEALSVFPANSAAMEAPVVTDSEGLSVFAEITATSDVLEAVDPRLPNSQELRKVFTNEMQAFFAGDKTAEQALQDAEDAWNDAISAAK